MNQPTDAPPDVPPPEPDSDSEAAEPDSAGHERYEISVSDQCSAGNFLASYTDQLCIDAVTIVLEGEQVGSAQVSIAVVDDLHIQFRVFNNVIQPSQNL